MSDLTCLGAARTVTGSKYLLEHRGSRVLVDSGLFQGLKGLRIRNWADFPRRPADPHAIVLTHADLGHVGQLPRPVARGYEARVFRTAGTKDLSVGAGWSTWAAIPRSWLIRDARAARR
jgi:metallo-beta-lactamase family protein